MKTLTFISILITTVLSSFGQHLESQVSALIKVEHAKENVHNSFFQVYSETNAINIKYAKGKFKGGDSVFNKNPFYIASIGKTFTATAVALLSQNEQLNFDDKIAKYLSEDILNGLHLLDGKDYSYDITIAQLLQHTSGLPDYFEDTTIDGSQNIITQIFSNPTKVWNPIELIEFTKQKMEPLFVPGSDYHYTDTEYVLLGLIIEKVSGLPLETYFKKYIFKPLGLSHTYMNLRSLSIDKSAVMAEIYAANMEISNFNSLSADWAGGGLVSTTEDLILFQEALFSEKFIKKETLQMMQDWVSETHGMDYGYGLRKIDLKKLDPSFPNVEVIGHSGSTGSFLFYCPSLDTYVAGTLNQTDEVRNSIVLIANVLNLILKKS